MRQKLTNILWRSMVEMTLLCLFIFAVVIYVLYMYGAIHPDISWHRILTLGIVLALISAGAGAFYGYRYSARLSGRLERLREAMIHLERGNLSHSLPALGEDEIGRIGELLGRISKKWEEQVTSLQRLSNHNAQLAEQARYSAIVEERQRLARELHDAVSQQLFAISMTATAVGRTLDKDFERAKRQIALIEEMASVAQSEMRALLLHLRPVRLEGKRLAQGLGELLSEVQMKMPTMEITWEMNQDIVLPRGIEDHLFRIAQEALSNALRHSKATKIEVKLQRTGESVRLSIRDNGVGFDLENHKHTSYGIVSMQERVNEIGGSLKLVTAPQQGTRIDIHVPILYEEGDLGKHDAD